VLANLGTKVNRRKRAVRLDPNVVKDIGPEWGDKGNRMVIKISDTRKGAEEVPFNELLLRYPKFLTAVVDNSVLVGVSVDGVGTGRGVEEIGEEIGYRYL